MKEVHYTNKILSYSCYFCGENFTDKTLFRKHMKLYRDGPKDYKCPEKTCDSRFRVKITLLDHIRKHRGIYEYSCEECSKVCTTRYTLKSHIRMHNTNSQVICHICSKVFKNKALVNNHIYITHADEEQKRRFECDKCDKAYPTTTRLKNHMVSHTGVRNFPCATCGKTYMTRPALSQHENLHNGVKPYTCEKCGKCFRGSNKLKRHEVIHTGEMNFNCSICGKKFNQKINKITHENKCHNLNEINDLSNKIKT